MVKVSYFELSLPTMRYASGPGTAVRITGPSGSAKCVIGEAKDLNKKGCTNCLLNGATSWLLWPILLNTNICLLGNLKILIGYQRNSIFGINFLI